MKITKKLTALVLAAALAATASGCAMNGDTASAADSSAAAGVEKKLNVFTWATYFPDDVLKEFTEKTGIEVVYSTFESNEEMLMKLQASKGGDYDIVLSSDYIIDIARKQDLIQKIDKEKVPNFKNINSAFQGKFYDETNEYTVPYSAGVPVIVYNPDLVDFNVKGYADLWNPALKDSLVMMDDARNVLGVTLKTMGESFNTTDTAKLQQAKTKLMELKPNIRALDYSTPYNLIVSGEVAMGYMFTSQAATALMENENLKVVFPEEGLGFGIDSCFVPANAPHAENAWQFLDFILDGERSAHISEQTLYLNCNSAATGFMSQTSLPENVVKEVLTVSDDQIRNAEFIQDVGTEATDEFNKIWTEFKQSLAS